MDLILKVSGIGLLITVLTTILNNAGKNNLGVFVNMVGVVVVLGIVIKEVSTLLNTIKTMFMLY